MKRSYIPSEELFNDAIYREYRIIQRFFDIQAAEEFKEHFKEIHNKIFTTNTATAEELLEVAEIIKRHN
ncbi:rIIA lysis inhibitor [Klebsiella phage KPV15]|uniref:RIIA lysis inhibitor n=1 Tax=Klebsiella phage KPV15 TaxID=1913572 RepID=A0A1J0MGX7_9CAUD|nr:rIIA lysis inhibitor [Klebsiella phage KPV15]APD20382.1 rIIA lysis inhibitor [Klebsiella phage KPV15]